MVKICGITREEEIMELNQLKPDYIGMVLFFPKSKRNLSPKRAKKLLEKLDPEIKKVAVTVSPTFEQAVCLKETGFDLLQVHGVPEERVMRESPLPLIRAFNQPEEELVIAAAENPLVKGLLFDAAEPGSGKTFDWSLMKGIKRLVEQRTEGAAETPKLILLSGGLRPENVAEAIRTVHPDAVDVSSGVEWDDPERPGKDPEKMRAFIHAARNGYQELLPDQKLQDK